MFLLFFKISKKRSLTYIKVALSKQVTHYGPLSAFLYYNLTTTAHREGEGTNYLQPVDVAQSSSVGLISGNLHQELELYFDTNQFS